MTDLPYFTYTTSFAMGRVMLSDVNDLEQWRHFLQSKGALVGPITFPSPLHQRPQTPPLLSLRPTTERYRCWRAEDVDDEGQG